MTERIQIPEVEENGVIDPLHYTNFCVWYEMPCKAKMVRKWRTYKDVEFAIK